MTNQLTSPETDAVPTGADPVMCSCCEHTEASHDEKARRYCQATQSRALTRGCICG